jgi:hypothetical protein
VHPKVGPTPSQAEVIQRQLPDLGSLVLYFAEDGSGVADGFEGSKTAMLDIGMIAIGVGFFVVSILHVFACERM